MKGGNRLGDVISLNQNSNSHSKKVNKAFHREGDYLMRPSEDGKSSEKISEWIEISEIQEDVDTKEIMLKLDFFYMGRPKSLRISRKMLTQRHFTELLAYGVDAPDHYRADVLKHLSIQEKAAKVILAHSGLGWTSLNGIDDFRLYASVVSDSVYKGTLNIEPKGSFENWLRLIRDNVLGNIYLELMLCAGLSAPVVSLISRRTGLEVLLVHLCGDSSKGKTVSTMLALSPFGSPNIKDNGLLMGWAGTENAITEYAKSNHGVPIGLDEASVLSDDMTRLVYVLAQGVGKARLNKNLEQAERAKWSTTIISTAENSLKDRCNRNTGIQMRLLEFQNITFTSSAENADAIKEGVLQNYGWAAGTFVKHLMEIGEETILTRWRYWKDIIVQRAENPDRLIYRSADKLAIIVLTSELVRESLGLDTKTDGILDVLLALERKSSGERNIGDSAYSYFLEIFNKQQHFFREETPETTRNRSTNTSIPFEIKSNEIWGKYKKDGNRITEITVLSNKLAEILKQGGFQDTNVVMNSWRESSILDTDKDGRFTRKRSIRTGTPQVRCYVIKVKEENS